MSLGVPLESTRVLVTGAGGQLGRAVVAVATARGCEVRAATHADLPVDDADACRRVIGEFRPSLVVHCAAWTDVDGCERDPGRADRINGHGSAYVAAACRAVDARLVGISTDYVFAATPSAARQPLCEDDPVEPASAYGRSKRLAEQAVLDGAPGVGHHVVRTSWLFGPGGRNFPAAILDRARQGGPLRVVDDQVGSPTLTLDLAPALLDVGLSEARSGVWHAANEGACSWYDFAVAICAAAGLQGVEIGRQSSAELDRPAPRPAWSVLDCSKLSALRGGALPEWRDALRRYLDESAAGEAR